MRHYQQRCFFIDGGHSNRVPALFASLIVDTIFNESEVWIIEHLRSQCKVDAVLLDVDKLLFRIPFESHRYTYCITSCRGTNYAKDMAQISVRHKRCFREVCSRIVSYPEITPPRP